MVVRSAHSDMAQIAAQVQIFFFSIPDVVFYISCTLSAMKSSSEPLQLVVGKIFQQNFQQQYKCTNNCSAFKWEIKHFFQKKKRENKKLISIKLFKRNCRYFFDKTVGSAHIHIFFLNAKLQQTLNC